MRAQLNFLALTLLLIISMVGCNQDETSSSADITIPVRLADVQLGSISNTMSVTGTVSPVGNVELKTQTSGEYLLQVNPRTGKPFSLGDKVLENEIIIKLQDKEFENTIRIETKKLDLDIKEDDYNKQKSLYDKGGVTLSNLQLSEVSFINSKYDYEKSQIQMEMLNISAPFEGVIVKLPYYTQQTEVSTGLAVVKIMNYSKLLLNVDFPEKNISTIKKGQKASITNYNMLEDTLFANVSQISPAIDENSRTFSGVLEVNNAALLFRPGMFVNAEIVLKRKEGVITVPLEIISKGKRGLVVYTISRNTAQQKPIKTGIETDTEVEIVQGLEIGDRIVVEGYEMLSNRAKVKVLK